MTKYVISFSSEAMVVTGEELPILAAAAHAVIEDAKIAGVYVFGGGIAEHVEPMLVSADGAVSDQIYPGSHLDSGFTVLELPTREDTASTKPALATRKPAAPTAVLRDIKLWTAVGSRPE